MSTAVPLLLPDDPHAKKLAEHLAPSSGGRSVEEIAESLKVSVSLEEAVERSWLTAVEKRQIEGHASRADLEELGYPPAEIEEILEEQKGRR